MAVTLEQIKLDYANDIQAGVIDEYQKSSFLLNSLPFHDAVSAVGGGAALTYGYTRLTSQPTAAVRKFNEDYTPSEVTKQRYTVDLIPFGGSYSIDRVFMKTGGYINEVALQASQKIKAATAVFSDLVINGDSATDKGFDGLEKALKGSSTDIKVDETGLDLTTTKAITDNAMTVLDKLEAFLGELNGTPSVIMGNKLLIDKLKAIARRSSMYQTTLDQFGRSVATYAGIPLIDLGTKAGSNDPIIEVKGGLTDLYVVRFDLVDGFHGVTLSDPGAMFDIALPSDDKTNKSVKTGYVEMVAAVALKSTKAAGVLRNFKVTA